MRLIALTILYSLHSFFFFCLHDFFFRSHGRFYPIGIHGYRRNTFNFKRGDYKIYNSTVDAKHCLIWKFSDNSTKRTYPTTIIIIGFFSLIHAFTARCIIACIYLFKCIIFLRCIWQHNEREKNAQASSIHFEFWPQHFFYVHLTTEPPFLFRMQMINVVIVFFASLICVHLQTILEHSITDFNYRNSIFFKDQFFCYRLLQSLTTLFFTMPIILITIL